jgi:2-keto-4-pentenoate hydratase
LSLDLAQVDVIAGRTLADYDAHHPNEIFAQRGTAWLTLDEAFAVQRAVAELRRKRGERSMGYKVGCVSRVVQQELGLREPVRGYLWQSESLTSGAEVSYSPQPDPASRFVKLAIEGEIALLLKHDVPSGEGTELSDYIDCWFPVIELHNAVFRGPVPTSQELIAGNAMHAGFVLPSSRANTCLTTLAEATIEVEIDGQIVETKRTAELPGGPLGSLCWLVSSLASSGESVKARDLVLTGSPGRLLKISPPCHVAAVCEGQRVELYVDQIGVKSDPKRPHLYENQRD